MTCQFRYLCSTWKICAGFLRHKRRKHSAEMPTNYINKRNSLSLKRRLRIFLYHLSLLKFSTIEKCFARKTKSGKNRLNFNDFCTLKSLRCSIWILFKIFFFWFVYLLHELSERLYTTQ